MAGLAIVGACYGRLNMPLVVLVAPSIYELHHACQISISLTIIPDSNVACFRSVGLTHLNT